MQAVILAGERGAPLYPLTARQPRAMLPLAGTPLVQYQLELLKRHGVAEAILCLQVMPEVFEERFGDGGPLGMALSYHREAFPLGTAGAVRSVADRLTGDTLLVLNGHVLTDADLSRLLAFHEEKGAAATLLLARVPDDPTRFGVVTCDAAGRVTAFAEKPSSAEEVPADTVNAGVYVLRRDLLDRVPEDAEFSFERQLFPQLLAEGVPVYGMVSEGSYWLPVSGLPDYQRGIADILERRVDVTIKGVPAREGVYLGADTTVHPTATLRGRIFINHHTEVGRDVRISGVCSIGSRCRIGAGAVVEDSVIWRGTVVEPGAVVRGSILGDNCVVRAGAVVQPGTVVGADGIIASVVAKLPTRGDIQRAAIKVGPDGWRGVIADDVTMDNVRLVTQAVCDWVRSSGAAPSGKGGLVVGYDRRAQSEEFARAAAQVARANDLPVLLADRECTSPMLAFACRYFDAAAGLMVTGSHRPARYGGLKIKAHFGGPVTPAMAAQIEEQLRLLLRSGAGPRPGVTGRVEPTDIAAPYREHCARLVDLAAVRAAGLKVVVDPMHGSAAGYLSDLLKAAGIDVTEIRSERNPYFDGAAPDPVPENLGALYGAMTPTRGADVGLALDGDGDRLGVCGPGGAYVDGGRVFGLLLRHLAEGRCWAGSVVRSVATTRMVDALCSLHKLPVEETPVGFRHAAERMLEGDVLMGGDENGGYAFKNHLPDRDGIAAALLLLEAMAVSGKGITALVRDLYSLAGERHTARAEVQPAPDRLQRVITALQSFAAGEFAGAKVAAVVRRDGTRLDFEDGSWLLLLPLGGEPAVVRLAAEAPTPERAQALIAAGAALVTNA